MLIVEGGDLLGKTTLCQNLLAHPEMEDWMYRHLTKPSKGFDRFWSYVENSSRYIVQDRFHLSEVVYAELRGDHTDLDAETYRIVDAAMRLRGAYTVVLIGEEKLIRDRWRDGEMYSLEQVIKVNNMFEELVHEPQFNFDVDEVCVLTEAHPYLEGSDIDGIVQNYMRRQYKLRTILDRKNDRRDLCSALL